MTNLPIYIWLLVQCLNYGTIVLFSTNEEIIIERNNLVTVLQDLPKEYKITFDVYLTSFVNAWTGVIHLTTGYDCCDYGGRTLSFAFNGNRAEFTSAVNSIRYATYYTKFRLLEWIKVIVNQQYINNKYIYTIEIDGENFVTVENTDAQIFKNLRLFVCNPWLNAQPGRIKNIYITNTNSMSFFAVNEMTLKSNEYLTTIKTLSIEYEITFEAYFTKYLTNTWSTVIYFIVSGSSYGRVFVITIYNSVLYACASVNNNANYAKAVNTYNLNEWIKISVKQVFLNGYYTHIVDIAGVTVDTLQNTGARIFQNIDVFVALNDAQPGFLRNLVVINGCPICKLLSTLSANSYDGEIHLLVNITTNLGCKGNLQNVYIYLQPETLLTLKKFIWNDSSVNDSNVQGRGKSFIINVGKITEQKYATFSAVFAYEDSVLYKKTNISIIAYNSWNYFCDDPYIKVINQVLVTPPEKPIAPVNKINPSWNYIQANGRSLLSESHQFVCQTMQNRQFSPCYQRALLSGVIKYLPIHVLEVFGYDLNTTLIYGLTTRNNFVEFDINKSKPIVITKEKCLQIPACKQF